MVVDPLGVAIARAGSKPELLWADLSADRLASARERLPVLANRRFRVDPGVLPLQHATDTLDRARRYA
jgi:predicted amidohydrolase